MSRVWCNIFQSQCSWWVEAPRSCSFICFWNSLSNRVLSGLIRHKCRLHVLNKLFIDLYTMPYNGWFLRYCVDGNSVHWYGKSVGRCGTGSLQISIILYISQLLFCFLYIVLFESTFWRSTAESSRVSNFLFNNPCLKKLPSEILSYWKNPFCSMKKLSTALNDSMCFCLNISEI